MNISVVMVKQVRENTGYGMRECKKALVNAEGDFDKAISILENRGMKSSVIGRKTNEGIIDTYIHSGNRIGAMIQLSCETDFVANTFEFKALSRNILMQIVATNPLYINKEELKENEDLNLVLMEQEFIKDSSKKVKDLIEEAIKKMGENIVIKKFVRYEL